MQRPRGRSLLGLFQAEQDCQRWGQGDRAGGAGSSGTAAVRSQACRALSVNGRSWALTPNTMGLRASKRGSGADSCLKNSTADAVLKWAEGRG